MCRSWRRVSAPVSFGRRHVAAVLGRLTERYPRLLVSLKLDDRLADLIGDGIDVAIRIGEVANSSVMVWQLSDNHRVLAAAPAYLDRAGRPSAPHELDHSGYAILRYGDSMAPWRLTGPAGKAVTIKAQARLRVDNGDAIHDWGIAGHGVMLKSQIDIAGDLAAGKLERVLPEWSGGHAPILALYPTARHMPRRTRAFLDAMVAYLDNI